MDSKKRKREEGQPANNAKSNGRPDDSHHMQYELQYGKETTPRRSIVSSKSASTAAMALDPEDSTDYEEGEISEESEDESEAIAQMIIAPRLQPKSQGLGSIGSGSATPMSSKAEQQSEYESIPYEPLSPAYASSRPVSPLPSLSTAAQRLEVQKPPGHSQPPSPTSQAPATTDVSKQRAVGYQAPPAASSKISQRVKQEELSISPPQDIPSTPVNKFEAVQTLILELQSWGVTPDYLFGQGVAKDTVLRTYIEHDLPLPHHHLVYYQQKYNEGSAPSPKPSRETIRTEQPVASAVSLPVSLPSQVQPSIAPDQSVRSATPSINLSEKEANARRQLLARKAALEAKRKADLAAKQFLEAEMGGLLSSGAPGCSDTLAAASYAVEADVPVPESDEMQISDDEESQESSQEATYVKEEEIGELREKVLDMGDQASQSTTQAPFSGSAIVPEDMFERKLQAMASAIGYNARSIPAPTRQRPVASDFEAEPVQSLANVPRWSAHLVPASKRADMVIELSDGESDDEDSDTEGLREAVKETKQQDQAIHPKPSSLIVHAQKARQSSIPPPITTNGHVRRPSPPNTTWSRFADSGAATPSIEVPPTIQPEASESTASLNELEAKQAEIKRMMEMISKMEGKKKQKGSGSSRGASPAIATPTTPSAEGSVTAGFTVPVSTAANARMQAVKARMQQLVVEKQELVDKAEKMKTAKEETIVKQLRQQENAVEEVALRVEQPDHDLVIMSETLPIIDQEDDSLVTHVLSADLDVEMQDSSSDDMLIIKRETSDELPPLERPKSPPEALAREPFTHRVDQTLVEDAPRDRDETVEARKASERDLISANGERAVEDDYETGPELLSLPEPDMTVPAGKSSAASPFTLLPEAIVKSARWTPYLSPCDLYPLSRQRPVSVSEVPAIADTSTTATIAGLSMSSTNATSHLPQTLDAVLSHQVRAWLVCKKRKLDLNDKWCQYEMLGSCNDDTCTRLHIASFIPTEDDILDFINTTYQLPSSSRLTQARKEVYQQGLHLIINRHKPALDKSTELNSKDASLRQLLRDTCSFYETESRRLVSTTA